MPVQNSSAPQDPHDSDPLALGQIFNAAAKADPFLQAVRLRKLEKVEDFLKKGQDPNVTDDNGNTALHLAAQKNDANLLRLLATYQANPHLENKSKETPLVVAIKHGATAFFDLLLKDTSVLETLDHPLTDLAGDIYSPLHLAISRDRPEIAERLLEAGVSIERLNAQGETPLIAAVGRRSLPLIRRLHRHGADINRIVPVYGSALSYACNFALSAGGADLKDLIRELILAGADPEIRDPQTNLPVLFRLVRPKEQKESLKALLAFTVNLEVRNAEGETPLLFTLGQGDNTKLEILLDRGANPNARNGKTGEPAIITAIKKDAVYTLRLLLDAGANPALLDMDGKSALYYARQKDWKDMILLLEDRLLLRKKRPSPTAAFNTN